MERTRRRIPDWPHTSLVSPREPHGNPLRAFRPSCRPGRKARAQIRSSSPPPPLPCQAGTSPSPKRHRCRRNSHWSRACLRSGRPRRMVKSQIQRSTPPPSLPCQAGSFRFPKRCPNRGNSRLTTHPRNQFRAGRKYMSRRRCPLSRCRSGVTSQRRYPKPRHVGPVALPSSLRPKFHNPHLVSRRSLNRPPLKSSCPSPALRRQSRLHQSKSCRGIPAPIKVRVRMPSRE